MTYELRFRQEALKEWRKLDPSIQQPLKKKLQAILEHPDIPAARLHGSERRYKIKLRSVGYRLVYEVRETELVVLVIAVGKRDKQAVYRNAHQRR